MAFTSLDGRYPRSMTSGPPGPSETAGAARRLPVADAGGTLAADSALASVPYRSVVARAHRAEDRGQRLEARRLYEIALRRLAEAPTGADASDILRRIARTHRTDADLELTMDCAEAAFAIAAAHADADSLGHAADLAGAVHVQRGELDQAESVYQQALGSALAAGKAPLAAMMLHNLAVVATIGGDLGTALVRYEASLDAYRTLGAARETCRVLTDLAYLHIQAGRWDDAAGCYDEAMAVARRSGDRRAQLLVQVKRAELALARGDLAEARGASARAMSMARRGRRAPAVGDAHRVRALVEREAGNHPGAERHLRRAHEIATAAHDILLLADTTKELAELYRRQGRNREALACLNRARCLFSQLRARRELADLGRRTVRLERDFVEVARRWGRSIGCTDSYTQGHSERVADVACALAAADGMDEQSLFWFRIGALLHDVGKLMLPVEVLNKCGPLSADEWALVRGHPSAGVAMLADIEFPWDVRPIVESHHERWDGTGYPHGLSGARIPRVARMVCIADVYDALTSQRSYKAALTHGDAIAVMRADSGLQFDPDLLALFEQVAARHEKAWSRSSRALAAAEASGAGGDPSQGLDAGPSLDDVALTDACRFRLAEDDGAGTSRARPRRGHLARSTPAGGVQAVGGERRAMR